MKETWTTQGLDASIHSIEANSNWPPQRLSFSNKARWWLRGMLVVFFLVLAGVAVWDGQRGWTPPPQGDETTTVHQRPLEWSVPFHGDLTCHRLAPFQPEVEGTTIQLMDMAPDGAHVTKGQVIGRYDIQQLQKAADEMALHIRKLSDAVKLAQEEVKHQRIKGENDTAKAKLTVELSELDREKYLEGDFLVELDDRKMNIALASRELEETLERLEHYRNFVRKGFGTPEQLRLKEIEATRAQYNLLREKARLMVLEKFTRKRQESDLNARVEQAKRDCERVANASQMALLKAQSDAAQAESQLASEMARLQRIKDELKNPIVRAPQSGYLIHLPPAEAAPRFMPMPTPTPTTHAAAAPPPSEPAYAIADSSQLMIKTLLNRAQIRKIRPGQKLQLSLDLGSPVQVEATLRTIAKRTEPEQRTDEMELAEYALIVEMPPQTCLPGLWLGLDVEGTVMARARQPQNVIPWRAVHEQGEQPFVYIRKENEQVEKRPVILGERSGDEVEVRDGLLPGERILLSTRPTSRP